MTDGKRMQGQDGQAAGKKPSKAHESKKKSAITQNGGNHNPYWGGNCSHFSFRKISKWSRGKGCKDGKHGNGRIAGNGKYDGGQFNGKHISCGIPRRSC